MSDIERVGVSLDKKLLSRFDELIAEQGYQNRSEAVRDLIRDKLSTELLAEPNTEAVAAVCLVYDHHAPGLMQKLIELQHHHLLQTICTMHIHLDAHDCMEVVVLRGKAGEINETAENIISQKGVRLGRINIVASQVD